MYTIMQVIIHHLEDAHTLLCKFAYTVLHVRYTIKQVFVHHHTGTCIVEDRQMGQVNQVGQSKTPLNFLENSGNWFSRYI